MFQTNQEYREVIIQTSRKLFARFGYRKTTIDDIANALGKAKGSVYYYFKGKEEIFSAVVEHEALTLRAELARIIRDHRDNPIEQLKGYVTMRLSLMKELANFYSALSDEYLQHLDLINKVREKYQRKELATLQAILHGGKNKGIFDVEDIHTASLAILAAMSGLENPLFLGLVESEKVDERIGKVMQILLYGLIKRP